MERTISSQEIDHIRDYFSSKYSTPSVLILLSSDIAIFDYRSSSVPLVISSAMVGTGINYVIFTDHQTFSFFEEIIRFR